MTHTHAHMHAHTRGVEAGMEADREGGRKGMFVVSSPWDCSKYFTLHPLAHLFIPVQSRIQLCCGYFTKTIRIYIYSVLHIAKYTFIQLNELWQRWVKQIAKSSKRQQDGSNSGFHD